MKLANVSNTMSSKELLVVINEFRVKEGSTEKAHGDLMKVIRDEFDDEINEGKISLVDYKDAKGENRPMYVLTLSQAKQLLVRESKAVRKAVIQYIEQLEQQLMLQNQPKKLTMRELLIQQLEMLDEIERLQIANDENANFASIIRVAKHNGVSETLFKWSALKSYCIERGLAIKKVPCPRFGYRLLYPIDAFKTLYKHYDLNFDFPKDEF